jgi:hypothetical protein
MLYRQGLKKLALAALVVTSAMGGRAEAADAIDGMPLTAPAASVAPYDWTGFHVGTRSVRAEVRARCYRASSGPPGSDANGGEDCRVRDGVDGTTICKACKKSFYKISATEGENPASDLGFCNHGGQSSAESAKVRICNRSPPDE